MKRIEEEVEKIEKEVEVIEEVEDITKEVFQKLQNVIQPKKKNRLTPGQKAADFLTKWAGSWYFILGFIAFFIIWIIINSIWLVFGKSWDKYPFILLNLFLSSLAAIQAPIILMSQNRESQRDRIKAEFDYRVNRKAEEEIRGIKKQLDRIEKKLK